MTVDLHAICNLVRFTYCQPDTEKCVEGKPSEAGKIIKIEKVSSGLVSEPFIFNNNLYVVRNGSIVQYN